MVEPALIQSVASYLPRLVASRLAGTARPLSGPEAEPLESAVLFADISGFTALSERLTQRGAQGAEELTRLLNDYFGQLIDLIVAHGGDVIKFAGDAVTALWHESDEDLATLTCRAAQCALEAQSMLHDYPAARDLRLCMRMGIGVGSVLFLHVGGVRGRWETAAAGEPLSQVSAANKLARPGEVVLSAEAWQLARARAEGEGLEGGAVRLRVIHDPILISSPRPFTCSPDAIAGLRRYVPAAVLSRLELGQTDWLAELRRLTILFINFPGLNYTTPLDRAQSVMCATQQALYRFEGSLNKISVDDKGASGIAALGLPPLAHEDDALRGVHAALAIQESLRQLNVRNSIGVATGSVFCGSLGNATRREYAIIGDVVNLAARLMQAAHGDILCDMPTYLASKANISFESLPPIGVKGKQRPIEIFRPTDQPVLVGTSGDVRKPIFGRRLEKAILAHRLEELGRRHSGGLVIVQGDVGVGKSRLVQDLVERSQAVGIRCLSGRAHSVGGPSIFHAWRGIFVRLLGMESLEQPQAQREQALRRLRDFGEPQLLMSAPLLNPVLSLDIPENELTRKMDTQARASATQNLLVEILRRTNGSERATAGLPSLIVLEDAQWLDSASWLLVSAVSKRLRSALLVVVTRPLRAPVPAEFASLIARPGTHLLLVEGMPPEDALELARYRLGVANIPEPVARLFITQAEGNPLFIEELAYALRDAGLIRVAGDECLVAPGHADLDAVAFAGTMQGVITSRIDRLTPSQQLTVKVASVIGRVFQHQMLDCIYPLEAERGGIAGNLLALEGLEIIEEQSPQPNLTYRFKHNAYKDVAYNLLPFAQRRQLHRAVAERIEEKFAADLTKQYSVLAHHWSKAVEQDETDPAFIIKAVDYLQKAGEQAVLNYANREAVELLNKALEFQQTIPENARNLAQELRLQLALGATLAFTHGFAAPEVEKAYARASQLCLQLSDSAERVHVLSGLWNFHLVKGRLQAARELAEDLLKQAKAERDETTLIFAHRALGESLFWRGDALQARVHLEQALSLYDPDRHRQLSVRSGQDPRVICRALLAPDLWLLGYPDQSLALMGECYDLAQQTAHPLSIGFALQNLIILHQLRREHSHTNRRARELITLSSAHGFGLWSIGGAIGEGWAQAEQGELKQGIAQMHQSLVAWRATGAEVPVAYFLGVLADTYARAGQAREALDLLMEAVVLATRTGEGWWLGELCRLQGEAYSSLGMTAQAEPCFDQALQISRGRNARMLELRAAKSLSRFWWNQGKLAEARELLGNTHQWFTEGHSTLDLQEAWAMLRVMDG